MKEITERELRELTQANNSQTSGCVSIYLPTSRRHPENQQDPIRFKNLAKSALEQAGQSELFSSEETSALEVELNALVSNREFWNRRTEWFGLALRSRQNTNPRVSTTGSRTGCRCQLATHQAIDSNRAIG